MAFITVSGETGCRTEELARAVAHRMRFEFIGEAKIESLLSAEFGGPIPPRAWSAAVTSIVSRLGAEHDLVVAVSGSEYLLFRVAGVLRVHVIAPEAFRSGNLMLDGRTDRAAAVAQLRRFEAQDRQLRKSRFGRTAARSRDFHLIVNTEPFDTEGVASIVEAAANTRGLAQYGLLSGAAEAQLQFQARLQLARFGIAPAGNAALTQKSFSHPSEQMFANLLDFYRIAWDYEPRSFPLQWDKDGKVVEAFTPDFFLPEFDLYVELTTMKQALVTKKNRKVKLLRAIYPHISIQVFYQKDFQDLIFKYGLETREMTNAR